MMLKKYKKLDVNDINIVGVVMFGLFGDVILRTPVLKALKDIFPNADIIAIVDEVSEIVLKNNDDVSDSIILKRHNQSQYKKNLNKIKTILDVRSAKIDLLVDLYSGGSSPLLTLMSGAKYRLGFCNKKQGFIYNIENECDSNRLTPYQRVNNYVMSIVEPLSNKKYSLKPIYKIPQYIEDEMKVFLESLGKNKIYILNLGASKKDKLLENEKYAFLVKYIYEKYGYIPAIILNPGQEYLQQSLVEDYLKPQKLRFVKLDSMTLDQIAALIKNTRFMITPDTGLMHLAMAFDRFICTIFTYTHPLIVDPNNHRFISIYNHFDEGNLYQHQDITQKIIEEKIDILFERCCR